MDLLKILVGERQGYAIAEFLSIQHHRKFSAISEAFRQQFLPEERPNVAMAVAYLLRWRPDATTVSARMIGIFVLFDAFHFHRIPTHHVFGPVFVVLLRNEVLCRQPAEGLQPCGSVDHRFLRHILQVGLSRVINLSPQQIIDHPEVLAELLHFPYYERKVISFAIRHLPITPISAFTDNSVAGLMFELKQKSLQDYFEELNTIGDDMQVKSIDDEAYAFYLLYRRVNMHMFPNDTYFLQGGLIRDARFTMNGYQPGGVGTLAHPLPLPVGRRPQECRPLVSSTRWMSPPCQHAGLSGGYPLSQSSTSTADAAQTCPQLPNSSALASRYAPGARWEEGSLSPKTSTMNSGDTLTPSSFDARRLTNGSETRGANSSSSADASADNDSFDDKEDVKKVIQAGCLSAMSMGEQQRLLKDISTLGDSDILEMVDADRLEGLIMFNPMVAIVLLCRIVQSGQADNHLAHLTTVPLSMNLLDTLSRVSFEIALPPEFLQTFLCHCYEYCKEMVGDKVQVFRLVKLVSLFTESLIQRGIIDSSALKCEALPFCLCFNEVGEVLELYRLLTVESV